MSYIQTKFEEFVKESAQNTPSDKLQWKVGTTELEIPSFKLNSYEKLLKKLKRFSKTIGFPEPVSKEKSEKTIYLIKSKNNTVLKTMEDPKEVQSQLRADSSLYAEQVKIVVFDLTMVDEVKPLEDWEILGTIDYKDSLVKPAPGKEVPMNLIKDINLSGNSYCDHCHKKIYRNKTVFVKNTETDEIKQVGGTCTKYYLGLDYKRVLGYLESLNQMTSFQEEYDMGEWGSFGIPMDLLYSVSDIIKYYIWHTQKNGHVTKKQAEAYNSKIEDGNPTKKKESTASIVAEEVLFVSYPPDRRKFSSKEYAMVYEEWRRRSEEFDENISKVKDSEVKEILDFVESKKDESNFMFNVSNKVKEGSVPNRLISYITGACSFYFSVKLREEDKKKELESKPTSNHIGEIGEKYAFKVVVTRISGFEGSFGWTNVYTMEDEKGNVITKFGTINDRYITNDDTYIQKGTTLEFTSDVKDHTEFNGVNQTTIGRLSKYNPNLTY